jgi:hypothetical protein
MSVKAVMSATNTSRAPGRRAQPSGIRVLLLSALALGIAGCSDATYAQSRTGPSQAGQTETQAAPTAPQPGSGSGMMGGGQMMGPGGGGSMGGMMGRGGMMGQGADQEAARHRGIIGLYLTLSADTVGAPARLVVRGTVPYAPAYNAGIESGDQIVSVDGRTVQGKKLDDVTAAIDGDVGTSVKLSIRRDGKSREVTLTRVAPAPRRGGHGMGGSGGGGMNGGMMDMMNMMAH